MTTAHAHHDLIPPGVLRLAGGMLLFALLFVSAVRLHLLPAAPTAAQLRTESHVQPVRDRMLRFADQNGYVRVTDTADGHVVAMIGQEGSGFIRGVMRGLARERRMHGLGADRPFRLTLYADGELSLTDVATGRLIELDGFGSTNRGAFLKLLEAR
jgi:putative photosynthetic complex assembly protein